MPGARARTGADFTPAASRGAVRDLILIGNPNVGKSVLFGALTRRYVTVSNYPGTTIEVTRGAARIDGQPCQILDTPGTNQLTPMSEDERVTRDILLQTPDACVLQVADAKNLRRALTLTMELAELGAPVVLALNMQDEARERGIRVSRERLEEFLGVPVVETVAIRRQGISRLQEATARAARPRETARYPDVIEHWIQALLPHLAREGSRARFLALQILSGDDSISGYLRSRLPQTELEALERLRREADVSLAGDTANQIRLARLETADAILKQVYRKEAPASTGLGIRLARWALHPLKGTLLLAGLLYATFWFVWLFGAGTLVDLLESGLFGQVLTPLTRSAADAVLPFPHIHELETIPYELELPLTPTRTVPLGLGWERTVPSATYTLPPGVTLTQGQEVLRFVHDLLIGPYGAISMGLAYGLAIVLPIVATFFLLFSVMEDSGYLPRLAVMVNRMFRTMGLNGKAVLPMILGLGCDTMATMVTRTLETVRERIIATILLALAIPCSAQLGVILALLATFPGALAVWSIFMVIVFLLVGLLASRVVPGESPMFYMELPPMRLPQFSNVLTKTYSRVQWYLVEIIPLFILASFLLWLGKITNALQAIVSWMKPVMAAIGLPGETAVAFIFGFFRRDYGAAGLYDLQTSGLLNARQLTVAAVTLTLFVPCIAQFLIMMKERGTKVAAAIAIFVSTVAFGSGYLLNEFLLITGILQ